MLPISLFTASESLVGVFGRAGYQDNYHRELVNSIGFVIFDKDTALTRVAGVSPFEMPRLRTSLSNVYSKPYGNSGNTNFGQPFYASDVVAFGGFAENVPSCELRV